MAVVVFLSLGLQSRGPGCGGRQREVFVEKGLHMCCCLRRGFVSKRAGFNLGQDSQTIDSPLLELFERDISGRRCNIEIQSVLVFKILVHRRRELPFPIIEARPSLWVNTCEVLSDHDCCGAAVPVY